MMERRGIMAIKMILLVMMMVMCRTASGLYSSRSDVVHLTEDNFKEKVLKNDGIVMVEFYAPWCGHCRSIVGDWDKTATALKGVVTVAAIDAAEATKIASKYQIQGFPTIKIFGADKKAPTDYQGGRTADAMIDAGLSAARRLVKDRINPPSKGSKPSKSSSGTSGTGSRGGGGGGDKGNAVITLTEDNFKSQVLESSDLWLVEFYAPWCGHCSRLAPEWEEAAKKLKGTVKLGAVDATVHTSLAGQYDVRGYPTIKVFPGGKNAPPQDYQGPREAEGIVDHALGLLDKYGVVPEVKQLTSPDLFNEWCSGAVICVLATLPHLVETGKNGREAYLSTLTEAAKKLRRSPVKLLWSEGGAQAEAESALGLTYGFPAVAALSKDKGVYATLKGSFNADSITKFITGLTTGKESTAPISGPFSINTVDAWDGGEAVVVEEEEFSLEDILGEEL